MKKIKWEKIGLFFFAILIIVWAAMLFPGMKNNKIPDFCSEKGGLHKKENCGFGCFYDSCLIPSESGNYEEYRIEFVNGDYVLVKGGFG